MPKLQIIIVEDLEEIPASTVRKIVDAVSQTGCVIVRQKDGGAVNHSLALARLGRHFGSPIRHKLSDENGVHPIRTIPGYPSYANTTNADLLLHTDGSFEENPPKVMLISCERPAPVGGDSRVCFASELYETMRRDYPDELPGLWLADSFTIQRDDRKASKPVFKAVGKNRIAITFRFGGDVEVILRPEAAKGFNRIVSLLNDPANFIEFKLQENEILVFDNTAVLHGRTDFPPDSGRVLHGLWLDGLPREGSLTFGFAGEVPSPAVQ